MEIEDEELLDVRVEEGRFSRELVDTVRRQASEAGIGMPSVAIYDSQDVNAFATGAKRKPTAKKKAAKKPAPKKAAAKIAPPAKTGATSAKRKTTTKKPAAKRKRTANKAKK